MNPNLESRIRNQLARNATRLRRNAFWLRVFPAWRTLRENSDQLASADRKLRRECAIDRLTDLPDSYPWGIS